MMALKNLLTSVVFSLAGVAVHSNAASENHRNSSGVCFQTTPIRSLLLAADRPPSPAKLLSWMSD
ncbi:hypothetical protein [Pseudomonas sp. PL-6]